MDITALVLDIDEVSSKYCRILNFIVTTGYKWRDPLISKTLTVISYCHFFLLAILETSISHRAFISKYKIFSGFCDSMFRSRCPLSIVIIN